MILNTNGGRVLGRFSSRRARLTPGVLAERAGGERMFDALEPRQLLAVNILNAIGNQNVSNGASATVLDLTSRYDNPALTGTIVRFMSTIGSFNVEMFDAAGEGRSRTTPITVSNFINNYINQGRYVNNMVHRTVNNFVVQGGGFTGAPLPTLFTNVATSPAIQNEPGNTNARGTIAMARIGGQVNSATSQWFINIANNTNLDTVDQGFTAFGRVLGDGMNVVDAIAALPRFNFDNPFGEVPLRNYTQQDFNNEVPVRTENLVMFSTIEVVPELSFTVSSSNSALVTPVIVGNRLVLQYGFNMTGSASITFRITSADGSFVEDNFNVNVTNPQAPGNLAVSPSRITALGAELTLTAAGPVFQNPSITHVNFYRDLNRNGLLDGNEAVDGFLGIDDTPGDGFSLSIPVQGDEFAGAFDGQIYIARGFDGANPVGGTTVVGAGSINRAPVIGLFARHRENFTFSPGIITNAGDNVQLFALNTFDRDGTVASVQFFRDANGNNVFDAGIDVLLGTDSTPGDGFSLTVSTTGFAVGVQTSVFARAIDNEGAVGAVVSAMLRVNAAPTIGSLTFSAPQITRGQAITLMANNVMDTDSGTTPANRISKVDFFRDSNGDGIFQTETDQFFTSITVGVNGVYSLTLTGAQTALFPAGTNVFFARPTDADFAFGAVAMASIVVSNAAPTVAALIVSPNPVANLGANLTLTATGVADSDGTVARVDFFRDANGNGIFDMGIDTLLGSDNTPANGFSITVNTGTMGLGFTTGMNRYFAVAFDNDGASSNTAAAANGRINAAPTIVSLTVNPDPIPRNGTFTLTATGVADTGEMGAGGTISRVEFYRDTNNNGVFDLGTDQLLGTDFFAAGGYTFTGTATGLSTSQVNRFFARAIDSENGVSTPVMVEVDAVNSRPTITSMSVSVATVAQLGASVTLTAVGVADVDGTIAAVRFFRDDGDGVFDPMTDTLLGEDTSAAGGFTLLVNTGTPAFGFAVGVNRFFAVPVDNDGALALNPATNTTRINAVPTIGMLAAPAQVARLSSITLTATDVLDTPDSLPAGTIIRVEFYRDTNGNGMFDLGVDALLGVGVRQGTTNTWALTRSTAGFDTGTNTFFVRAQDNNLGFSIPDASATTTADIVNATPLITSVSATPNPLAGVGSNLTLTATGARDTDGTVASVQFFRDDGDGVFDPMTDTLLGEDTNAAGGYTLVVNTGGMGLGFVPGVNRYWARVMDNDGGFSNAVTNTNRINAAPTIGGVADVGPALRGTSVMLTATDVVDTAEPGFTGAVTLVQFYRDLNNNGVIDTTDRLLGNGIRQVGTDNWRITFSTAGFNVGDNTILVRARDNNLGESLVTAALVNVVNAPPTFTSTSVTPATVAFLGQNITITPVGARDSDGTIATVLFFLETNGEDDLQPDGLNPDLLIGVDNSAAGGWNLTIPTLADLGLGGGLGFMVGMNRVYACVIDNDGGNLAIARDFTITATNQQPTIDSVTAPDVGRGLSFMITANTVADADGTVSRVEFYADTNGNGVLDLGIDRLLGSGVPSGGIARLTTTASGAGLGLGMNTIFARAQDNRQVFGEAVVGTVNVINNVPTIVSLTDTPDPLRAIGTPLTLTAAGVADRDGTIAMVNFYRDDGDGVFDPMTDTLLGTDMSAVGGWSLVVDTGNMGFGFTVGANRFFAQAVDNNGGLSTAVTTTTRINAAPTIGGVADVGPALRGTSVMLTATDVVDTAEPGFTGAVTLVQFYRDLNNNGVIDTTDRLLGNGVRQVGTDNWRITFSTAGFNVGDNTILVRARDNNLGESLVTAALVNVVNAPPTFTSTSVTPGTVAFLGQNITITPVGARDSDGVIATVLFFLETNGEDDLQPDGLNPDLLIGVDNSAAGGWTLTIPTLADLGLGGGLGFMVGMNRVYACVIDNDGGNVAIARDFTITATNQPPTVGQVSATANPVNRGNATTLVATTLNDPDGTVTRVEFFLDVNNNGVVDANIDRLLGSAGVFAGQATLSVNTQTFAAGTNQVLARAIDNRQSAGAPTAGMLVVNNNNPTATSLRATPNPIVNLGDPLLLTALGVADRDGQITSAAFYFDIDNNNILDPMVDVLLGTDTSAVGGWSLSVNTGDAAFQLTAATNRFFALITDNDGGTVTVATTHRINSAPVIGSIDVTPVPISRSGLYNITISGVQDDAGVSQVLIYRDSNFSDDYETTDLLIGSARRIGTSTDWIFTGNGAALPAGTYKLFFRARDTNGVFSAVSFTVVQVV